MIKRIGLAIVRRTFIIASVAFLAVVALIAGVFFAMNYKSPGTLTIFAGGAPGAVTQPADGSPGINQANDAIDFAHMAKIDIVNNYSAIDANPSDISAWLEYAKEHHVKVGINLTYFVDPSTEAPENQKYYDLYLPPANPGDTKEQIMEAQVENFLKLLKKDPSYDAVARFFIDERPASPAMVGQFGDRFEMVAASVKKLVDRPLALYIEHGADDLSFLKALKGKVDEAVPDYYPIPESRQPGGSFYQYGSIEQIRQIARDVHSVFGDKGGLSIQGFSHYVNEPDNVKKFGFPPEIPTGTNQGAPLAEDMVAMARLAHDEGICNFHFFDLEYANAIPDQRLKIFEAARQIREFGLNC